MVHQAEVVQVLNLFVALNCYIPSYVERVDESECIIIATDNILRVYELMDFHLKVK